MRARSLPLSLSEGGQKISFFVKCLQTAVKAVAEVNDGLYLSSQDLVIVHEIVSFSIAAK